MSEVGDKKNRSIVQASGAKIPKLWNDAARELGLSLHPERQKKWAWYMWCVAAEFILKMPWDELKQRTLDMREAREERAGEFFSRFTLENVQRPSPTHVVDAVADLDDESARPGRARGARRR